MSWLWIKSIAYLVPVNFEWDQPEPLRKNDSRKYLRSRILPQFHTYATYVSLKVCRIISNSYGILSHSETGPRRMTRAVISNTGILGRASSDTRYHVAYAIAKYPESDATYGHLLYESYQWNQNPINLSKLFSQERHRDGSIPRKQLCGISHFDSGPGKNPDEIILISIHEFSAAYGLKLRWAS